MVVVHSRYVVVGKSVVVSVVVVVGVVGGRCEVCGGC